jgi:regulator of replication initiation timing
VFLIEDINYATSGERVATLRRIDSLSRIVVESCNVCKMTIGEKRGFIELLYCCYGSGMLRYYPDSLTLDSIAPITDYTPVPWRYYETRWLRLRRKKLQKKRSNWWKKDKFVGLYGYFSDDRPEEWYVKSSSETLVRVFKEGFPVGASFDWIKDWWGKLCSRWAYLLSRTKLYKFKRNTPKIFM